ncbi:MAG: GH3 auxin-responsive promoter family protein [Bacteroidales bacterium]|nr:GH3 auxin-responsive promoter family protein [Bacteroidales bacterium]MBN2820850.1 GH3 auxin-responsive promoter family protein [Bacteroidales bacterium]
MPIITSLVKWFNIKRISQIDLIRKYPFNVQHDMFDSLISKGLETEWGRMHDYQNIRSIKDFQDRVPLQTYEEVKPYVDRLRKGELDLLWPGEIKWFAKSSGTTADKSKFIPVSKDSLERCHFRGGKDVLAIYTNNYPESGIFKGKGLTLGGSHKIDNYSNKSFYGDLSAILIENLPFWTEFIRTPSQQVALLDKWEEKLEKIALETIQEKVTSLAGVPSWNLVMLKYILEYTGKNNVLEIWPDLELFIHGGVSFGPYREQFEKIIPTANMHYLEAYNASEGFFAIQDDPDDSGMLLMLDYGIFYEFIPMVEYGSENPKTLTIEEVETGVNYAIVITTNSGLWRYIIGDTVKFTSKFPHKLVITGRTKHFINVFGEEVIIDNAERALSVACEKTASVINEYSAAPVFMSDDQKGSHEWVIEFAKAPNNLNEFTYHLDNALQNINSDYEAKRYKNITLDIPIVHAVSEGTFFIWMEKRGKLGGQNKVPRLSNSRQYLEELLEISELK